MRRLLPDGVGVKTTDADRTDDRTLPRCNSCHYAMTLDKFMPNEKAVFDLYGVTYPKLLCTHKSSPHSFYARALLEDRDGAVCCLLYISEAGRKTLTPDQKHQWREWKAYRDEILSRGK